MAEIPLTQGKVALVDDEDFEVLSAVKWRANRCGQTCYAWRSVTCSKGKQKPEQMHRLVLARKLGRALAKGEHCDHINGNGIDNRRENLHIATKAQNNRNCRRHSRNPSSRFLGVSWHKHTGKWQARVRVNGELIHLGYHATELNAAKAREAYISAHPELNARSNFSTEGD